MITAEELHRVMPNAGARVELHVDALNSAMAEFEINNCLREAAFLAQVAHESGELRYMEELASGDAYELRADLGNTKPEALEIAARHGATPGRWWKGHGPIQITGYDNHLKCGQALDLDLLNEPLLLTAPVGGARSAAWFFKTHGLNGLADQGNFLLITKRINGGTNGWASRVSFYEAFKKVFS